MVGPVSQSTFGMLSAYRASVNSAAGGFYEVDRDQLAFIHKQEMVLPAAHASALRNAVENGGAGSGASVNVFHNVNAIDAASFKDVLKRHSNIIGQEVARILRKKGIAGS